MYQIVGLKLGIYFPFGAITGFAGVVAQHEAFIADRQEHSVAGVNVPTLV